MTTQAANPIIQIVHRDEQDIWTVRFGRTIEASFGRITRTLGKYISAVSPGDDGRSVVFTLQGDFDAYSFDSGNAVIVEIADKEPEKPGQPKKVSGKKTEPRQREGPSDLPSIRVRTGQHAAYTRIVFDWPRKVPYTFKQEAGVATVTFARPARLNLKAIQSRPPRYIGGVRSRISDDGVTGPMTIAWSQVSGPGPVDFGESALADSTAMFSEIGQFVLRLTADDGERMAGDEVAIFVTEPSDQKR